jgi:DNA-directed RNA polymerase specialized sigma54-like protein
VKVFDWSRDFYGFFGAETQRKAGAEANLTPGLVQMVSVLALNKLELSEMISQELMENPVLEEVAEPTPTSVEEAHNRGTSWRTGGQGNH